MALALFFFGLFALLLIQMSVNGDWFWLAQPPVPNDAMDTQIFFPSMGATRDITFETIESAEKVGQFYQEKLKERGWRYLCSPTSNPTKDCPFWRSPGAEIADIYVKDDFRQEHTLAVEIFPSKVRQVPLGHYMVEITEIYRPRSNSHRP